MPAGGCLRNPQASRAGCLQTAGIPQASPAGIPQASPAGIPQASQGPGQPGVEAPPLHGDELVRKEGELVAEALHVAARDLGLQFVRNPEEHRPPADVRDLLLGAAAQGRGQVLAPGKGGAAPQAGPVLPRLPGMDSHSGYLALSPLPL